MEKIKTKINGVFIIKNNLFIDKRGEFMETWNTETFKENNLKINFSQDNISISKKNTLRGLHFQNQPYGQTKYVRVIKGKALDVVVDIRKESKTFGKHISIELSNNRDGLWIPPGMAHGFLSLEENTIFTYKCSGQYQPKYEHTIKWNDPDINIQWGTDQPIVSEKDQNGISLKSYLESNQING
tara:strand:+ start:529 stop:1080 length:552 start_codon:yes stop_codon:yes gene_type:complete